jgi:hypothetical protein
LIISALEFAKQPFLKNEKLRKGFFHQIEEVGNFDRLKVRPALDPRATRNDKQMAGNHLGANVMIMKIFSPNKLATNRRVQS